VRRLAAIILGAVALGALLSLLKGVGGGARLQFGNLSAPWLAVGFFAGVCYRRVVPSAAAGVLATVAALCGFYAEQSPLGDFSSGSLTFLGHPAQMYDFIVTPHLVVFIGGILTGVLFGALGTAWATHRSRLAPGAVALLFVCEPFGWLGSGATSGGSFGRYWWMWSAEIALGLAAIIVILRPHRIAS
jgi:hypothetical protein